MNTEVLDKEYRRDTALKILKGMTADDALQSIADAVAELELPQECLNELFLSKVLYNKHLYKGWLSVGDLVAKTTRQGLYRRDFGDAVKPATGRRKRRGAARTAKKRGGSDTTVTFLTAAGIAKPMSRDVTFAPFRGIIQDSAKRWTDLFRQARDMCDAGTLAAETAVRMLEARAADAGGDALCLAPVDRLAALVLARASWDANVKALRAVAEFTRSNLNSAPNDGCAPVAENELPASRGFLKKFLGGKVGGDGWYTKEFFAKHQMYVWDAALSCWAFSLAGRNVDGGAQAQALALIRAMCGLIGSDFGDAAMDMVPSAPLFCSMRDADQDVYGYRTCVCGVYRAADAVKLAKPAAEARAWLMRHSAKSREIAGRLLKADLMLLGASMTASVRAYDMFRLSAMFGRWLMW